VAIADQRPHGLHNRFPDGIPVHWLPPLGRPHTSRTHGVKMRLKLCDSVVLALQL
jgi:hypothetical protein